LRREWKYYVLTVLIMTALGSIVYGAVVYPNIGMWILIVGFPALAIVQGFMTRKAIERKNVPARPKGKRASVHFASGIAPTRWNWEGAVEGVLPGRGRLGE
jgi:hypothetical protein